MDIILATVFVVAAITLALLFRRRYRYAEDPDEGISVRDLVGPLETLAVLVIAFVLVLAAQSYSGAGSAASAEAAAIDSLHATADLLPEPARERVKADSLCYARAVIAKEWHSMGAHNAPSPTVDHWTEALHDDFQEVHDPTVLGMLTNADRSRLSERRDRIEQSAPAIPGAVFWFMVLTVIAMVAGYALSLPRRRHRLQLAGLWVLAGLLVASLYLIWDIDRPFRGLVPISPSSMRRTEQEANRDFLKHYNAAQIPCDRNGLPRA
ncbi:bestrophin-like domain [Actinomadura fibrosa]|uniref:DUF4239 domain-containing protein n=1 Tax=Actinomadura fibrosa TaxID=111802 RepID=A0ABW2XAI7_9ACTN|nr:DUF4239 domain-containing protein [Actinomadura fibrosa]